MEFKWVDGTRLSNLAYADGVALLSEDAEAMNRLNEKLLREAAKVGLQINQGKAKVLTVQAREDTRVEIEGNVLEEVKLF